MIARRPRLRLFLLIVVGALSVVVYRVFDSRRVDSSTLAHDAAGPVLRVTILGTPNDPRITAVREAIDNWNREFIRLGRRVHLDSGTVRKDSVPDDLLRAASGDVWLGFGPRISRLYAALGATPGDVVIALSKTDLISLPNTLRNVTAHELGHVLGLDHNRDSKTLMCGRPAPCRPADFASDTARFFPLTSADEQRLRNRWP